MLLKEEWQFLMTTDWTNTADKVAGVGAAPKKNRRRSSLHSATKDTTEKCVLMAKFVKLTTVILEYQKNGHQNKEGGQDDNDETSENNDAQKEKCCPEDGAVARVFFCIGCVRFLHTDCLGDPEEGDDKVAKIIEGDEVLLKPFDEDDPDTNKLKLWSSKRSIELTEHYNKDPAHKTITVKQIMRVKESRVEYFKSLQAPTISLLQSLRACFTCAFCFDAKHTAKQARDPADQQQTPPGTPSGTPSGKAAADIALVQQTPTVLS
jgi:hypothetical protein